MARILFLTDFSEAYARNLLLGIARYAHAVGQAWSLCRLPLSIRDKFGIEAVIDLAKKMRADAVIGQFYNTDNVELFARNGIITIAQDFKARFTTIPNITGPHFLAGKMGPSTSPRRDSATSPSTARATSSGPTSACRVSAKRSVPRTRRSPSRRCARTRRTPCGITTRTSW